VTPTRHGSAVVDLPNDLDVVITREFEAPIGLVFDVLTKPEHVTRWMFERELKVCSIDLRVGGSYHMVFITNEGREMSFRGTYLEVDPPTRVVSTWLFEGRPDADAVDSVELHEVDGVTTMTAKLTFSDKAGRDETIQHGTEGMTSAYDRVESLIRSLLADYTRL
jgi:uncharacterized protein YndB with AHSA1/START domain